MTEKEKRNQVTKISVFITSIFVIVLSISYAFLNQTLTGTKKQVITAGNLQLELEENNQITLSNTLPMYDEVGMTQDSYDFKLINKSTERTKYSLRLKDVTESSDKLDTNLVKYGITKNDEVTINLLSSLTDNVLDTGTLEDSQIIDYKLRLWIDSNVEVESLIKSKTLSYKIEVEAEKDTSIVPVPVAEKLFSEENLGENCKTYNDGIDTFLVGQCSQNYVWYSGKLWRIVLKNNETGAIKMITDNSITAMPYNASENTTFENSYVDQWLTQEFLPTLYNYQDYLVVDSVWDATTDNSSARPVGTTTVTRTVGLLNSYEFCTTYNKSDSFYGFAYLNNGNWWWLITPYSTSRIMYVYQNGQEMSTEPSVGYGVRPSVNLKSDINITLGSGTRSKPYRLEGDIRETVNGATLLSTRYSGEYVTFNNELYRIVGVENGKTKIVAVDKPASLANTAFHNSSTSTTSFANATIKTDLETYYQNNIIEPYKSMIEPNQMWYLGTVGSGENYKASICKTVSQELNMNACERTDTSTTASVALPRVGEMFTSQITQGTRNRFWTLTPYSTSKVNYVETDSHLEKDAPPLVGFGARPSMYLKSNVVISKDNTGDGTYEHPYDIELGE